MAQLTAAATFPLIFMGGLVTSKDAGLSVPDWPSTFGYNMFTFPWSQMVGQVFYEHGHRLLGSLVGLLVLALTIWTFATERRLWLKSLVGFSFLGVCIQGLLGGLRVTLVGHEAMGPYAILFAVVHGCFAQAVFVLLALTAIAHGPALSSKSSLSAPRPDIGGFRAFSLAVPCLIYGQLIIGAVLRHLGRGLELHMAGAVVVAVAILWLHARARRDFAREPALLSPAIILVALLCAQIMLGLGAWMAAFGWGLVARDSIAQDYLPTLHVVTGALILVTAAVLALRARLLLAAPSRPGMPVTMTAPEVLA